MKILDYILNIFTKNEDKIPPKAPTLDELISRYHNGELMTRSDILNNVQNSEQYNTVHIYKLKILLDLTFEEILLEISANIEAIQKSFYDKTSRRYVATKEITQAYSLLERNVTNMKKYIKSMD